MILDVTEQQLPDFSATFHRIFMASFIYLSSQKNYAINTYQAFMNFHF